MSDQNEMDYKYASERKVYYLKNDSSLRSAATYITETLSSEQRKVLYEYANNHSSGTPFRGGDNKSYVLKREGGDYILL